MPRPSRSPAALSRCAARMQLRVSRGARLLQNAGTSGTSLAETVGARTHHEVVTDEPAPTTPTVRDRHTAAGLSDERIAQHRTAGRVRVDGELVTDLDAPAPAGTRVVVWAE